MDVISSLGVILSEVVTARAKVSIDRLEILPLLASYEHHPIFFARVGPVKQYGIGRAYPRYAIAGVPAAVLLVAFAVGSLPQRLRVPLVALMVLACLPDLGRLFVSHDRNSWFRPVSWQLDQHAGPDQLVLVHSIPSGILGIARYTHTATPLALWTQQLRNFENRNNANAIAADVVKLTAGYRKIYAVSVHDIDRTSPELDYLRQHAKIAAESRYGGYRTRMLELQPLNGEVFAWP